MIERRLKTSYITKCIAIKEAITSSPRNKNIRIIINSKSFTKALKATKMKKWSLKKPSKGTNIIKRIKRIIRERERMYGSIVTFTHIFFHIERKSDVIYKRRAHTMSSKRRLKERKRN